MTPPRLDDLPDDDPRPSGLSAEARRHLGRGFNWLGGASIAARIVDLLTIVAMLLMLTKQQVGVGSLVVSIGMIVEAFNGLGTGDALIQSRHVSRDQLDTVFWYVLAAAGLAAGATLLAAPLIGHAYRLPGLGLPLLLIAAKMPLVGAAVVPLAMLNRELRFRRIAAVNLAATLAAAATRLVLAAAGAGALALVAGYAISGLFILVGAAIAHPFRPRRPGRPGAIAPLVRFGLRSTLANAAEQMFKNVDYLLVGWFYGAVSLATYRLAFDVAMEPPLAVSTIVNRASLPVLAREAAAGGDLTAILAWSLGKIATLVVPLLVALVFAAAPLTAMLHDAAGNSYTSAAGPLAILAVAALVRVMFQPLSTVLVGAGRPGMAARLSLATLAGLAGGVALVGATLPARAGLLAVSTIWLVIYPALAAWGLASLRRHEAIRLRPLLRAVARPAAAGLALAAILALARHLAAGTVGPAAWLALVCLPTAGCYLVLRRAAARAPSSNAPPSTAASPDTSS